MKTRKRCLGRNQSKKKKGMLNQGKNKTKNSKKKKKKKKKKKERVSDLATRQDAKKTKKRKLSS